MNRTNIVRWFVLPFGSLRTLAILALILFIGGVADLGSTYYFLNQPEFGIAAEGNAILRALFISIGFWPAAALNIFTSLIFAVFFSAVLFYASRKKISLRAAKIIPASIFISFGLARFLVAVENFLPFDNFYLASSLVSPPVLYIQIAFIWLCVILFLYRLGYGKTQGGD